MVGESQFIDAVARRTGLSWLGAVRATYAVLRTLGERLTADQVDAVADELAPELGTVLKASRHGEQFELHELLQRVELRTGAHREPALDHVAAVGMTLGEAVSDEVLGPIRAELPPAIGFLLRPPTRRREERADEALSLAEIFFSAH